MRRRRAHYFNGTLSPKPALGQAWRGVAEIIADDADIIFALGLINILAPVATMPRSARKFASPPRRRRR